MPSRTPSPNTGAAGGNKIDKLDFDENRLKPSNSGVPSQQAAAESRGSGARLFGDDASFFSDVVEGVIEHDRRRMRRRVTKYIAFASAILSCLCAGSITAYSLYGPLFLRHLKYSQYQVNAVSTAAELALYLPVPFAGWFCDRYNPRPLSAFSGVTFGLGYALAAGVYKAGPVRVTYRSVPQSDEVEAKKEGWPFGVMVFAFVLIGLGTLSMYITAITTCAKNFGRGKHKGITLAIPIAAFGLSGMWQSMVGSHFFKDKEADGNVDVFRYFCFLAGLFLAVGLIGSVALRVVDEEELIEEGVDELERSGLLDEGRRRLLDDENGDADNASNQQDYGSISHPPHQEQDEEVTSPSFPHTKQHHHHHNHPSTKSQARKARLLNVETAIFLRDPTMYLLAAGFFLTSGPGEAYLNNLGTLVHTLYPPFTKLPSSNTPATHVSTIAITSTIARLATGALADLLAPTAEEASPPPTTSSNSRRRNICASISLPRPAVLLASALLFSLGQLLLATPLLQHHPSLLPVNTSLVGFGYGAIFSLTPIIISVVWGVQNFGTNWGIVALVPAIGAAIWGAVYSAVYSRAGASGRGGSGESGKGDTLGGGEECFGGGCYRVTFGAMTAASWVAVLLWAEAWRRWRRRGVVV